MGFVKTADEIARIQHELSTPRFMAIERLSVQFRTDPEVLRLLLPPPLEPADDPIAVATIGRWHSNCLGDFDGGSIYLPARWNGIDGAYVLALFMDTEPPTNYGRDLFGEPKKLARTTMVRDGDHVHAWIERHGVRIIEIETDLTEDLGPTVTDRSTFNIKSRSSAGGYGLEEDAILTRTQFHTEVDSRRTGPATLALRSSPHDPIGELPVVELLGATYAVEDSRGVCEPVATIPANVFLPYHLGQMDDYLSLNTIPE